MGYYATVSPNTALAKEAFLANIPQGRCYFDNFFRTYALAVPLLAAAVFWVALLGRYREGAGATHPSPRFWATLTPPLAAAAHVAYIVIIGGDYMHGRMFLPAAFAALTPLMMVPVPAPRSGAAKAILGLAGAVIATWLPICVTRLRGGVENLSDIGDER